MNVIRKFISWNRTIAWRIIKRWPHAFDEKHSEDLLEVINTRIGNLVGDRNVLEVGGIDRPLLMKNDTFQYDGLDVEEREQCHEIYDSFYVQSVEEPILGKYSMIISKALLEHVPDNQKSFRAMHDSLKPGGMMVHYIPCKNHPFSLATRIVGHRVQRLIIPLLRPGRLGVTGYRTFYNLCTPGALERELKKIGFRSIEIHPYFGAIDYFTFFLPAFFAMGVFNLLCRTFQCRFFASGVIVIATRHEARETTADS